MRKKATHKDLARLFNRTTELRRDVRLVLVSGTSDHEEVVLQGIYSMLADCRVKVEELIAAHPHSGSWKVEVVREDVPA